MLVQRSSSTLAAVSRGLAQRRVANALVQRRNHGGMPCGSGACGMPSLSDSGKDSGVWSECKKDIAFKPNASGWGFNQTYSSGWDRIFGKKNAQTSEQGSAQEDATAAVAGSR